MTWLNIFKMNVFNTFHDVGLIVVLIDPKVPGVDVPEQIREGARVLLHFGDSLPIPIPDLEVNAEGVRATLSFQQNPVKVSFPWAAVMAIGLAGTGMFCQFHQQAMESGPEQKPDPEPEAEPKPEGGKVIPFGFGPGGMKNN